VSVYLDCAATTPIDPRVSDRVVYFMREEFGNAGSRTHDFGVRARRAVEQAREQVARVVEATRGEVVFTSGATESNNLAILGLAEHGIASGKRHVVSTRIEHHAVLGPLEVLASRGFEVTLVPPTAGGWVEPRAVRDAARDDTLLVSVMHVNNETGVIQPVEEVARAMEGHPAFLHVDAAQSFGRVLEPLRNTRIDLISISGHKVHAPKGIGALMARKRGAQRPPLSPLMHGGGQELGLRPGTLPVHLIAGLGLAAELAAAEGGKRAEANLRFRRKVLDGLAPLRPVLHGDQERVVPHILNLAFPGIDAEDAIEVLDGVIAVSTGAACTTTARTCSHVLEAMGMHADHLGGVLRLSWCHTTGDVDWSRVVGLLRSVSELSGRGAENLPKTEPGRVAPGGPKVRSS
jgi:cysteine desulfurase